MTSFKYNRQVREKYMNGKKWYFLNQWAKLWKENAKGKLFLLWQKPTTTCWINLQSFFFFRCGFKCVDNKMWQSRNWGRGIKILQWLLQTQSRMSKISTSNQLQWNALRNMWNTQLKLELKLKSLLDTLQISWVNYYPPCHVKCRLKPKFILIFLGSNIYNLLVKVT